LVAYTFCIIAKIYRKRHLSKQGCVVIVKTQISNLAHTAPMWNNLHIKGLNQT